MRSYPSSRASTRDFPQTVVKLKTEEPDAVDIFNALGGPESDDLFGPVSAKFRQLQKETTQQVPFSCHGFLQSAEGIYSASISQIWNRN
jgi:hypothetical protein